jgi:excisionase family DNA binding protein
VSAVEAARPLADVPTVAQRLSVSDQWVRDHAKALGGIKLGRLWRFDLADVERYLNRHKTRDPLAPTELSAKRQASKRKSA